MSKSVCKEAVEIAKEREGLYLEAYLCPAGVPTIGYGHTKGVKLGQKISKEQAEAFLTEDMAEAAEWVDKLVPTGLSPEQRGALADFVFNLGPGSLQVSTLRKKLQAQDYLGAAEEFEKWVYATVGGKKQKLGGLEIRRRLEKELFLKGTKQRREV